MIKNTAQFRKELIKINKWWTDKVVSELEGKRFIFREVFNKIKEYINSKRIIVISGPRRVGKTVLMKQFIQKLISEYNRTNILYYSLDDPSLLAYSDNLIKDLIDYFVEEIAEEGKKFIFLDEVHLFKGWHKWIKAYYDRYSDIKFILSGSSSLNIQKEASKYLRGRVINMEMLPLEFREFLELSNFNISLLPSKLDFGRDIEFESIHKKIKKIFEEYLTIGSFPEWFEVKDKNKWFDMLIEDIPKKAVYEDSAELFNVRNPKLLELVLSYIIANQSRILSYETINEVANVDRNTLVNYIDYLKSTYLVIEILKYSKNIKEQLKSMKKYLAIDQGLRNSLLKEYNINEDNMGFIVENVVGIHLFRMSNISNKKIFYLRKNGEIDFILESDILIPIEVKYKKNIDKSDLKFIKKFMKEKNLNLGIIITRSLLKKEANLLFIPAWVFILVKDISKKGISL